MKQFIIEMIESEHHYYNNELKKTLGFMMGLSIEVINISKIRDNHFFIIVNSEESKIKRLKEVCKSYMDGYDKRWGFPELKKDLASGKINQKKYDQKLKEMTKSIDISIIEKEDIDLPLEEKRADVLDDLLSKN